MLEDLFHRLNVMRINTPPLRQRREDIPILIEHYLAEAGSELGASTKTVEDLDGGDVEFVEWSGDDGVVVGRGCLGRPWLFGQLAALFLMKRILPRLPAALIVVVGSVLAVELLDLGADVLLVDSLIPEYGGNLFNIDGFADSVIDGETGFLLPPGDPDLEGGEL